MLTATIEDLISWNPCYSEARIRSLAGDVTEFTALDVLAREDISAEDRLWVVLRPELIDDRTLRLFACDEAERVLPIYERLYPDDKRPRNAIEVARRFAYCKATREELDAARDAAEYVARSTAWDAAGDAAWDAARYAAGEAAGDAARVAARYAARVAAWDAARVAAWDAERKRQVERLRQRLAEKETQRE
jgi:hypothetical protein